MATHKNPLIDAVTEDHQEVRVNKILHMLSEKGRYSC
jgi:hypothetical protein